MRSFEVFTLCSVPEKGGENETQIYSVHLCLIDYFDSMGLWLRNISNVSWPSIAQEPSGLVTMGF
jgi:hypothetical protein